MKIFGKNLTAISQRQQQGIACLLLDGCMAMALPIVTLVITAIAPSTSGDDR